MNRINYVQGQYLEAAYLQAMQDAIELIEIRLAKNLIGQGIFSGLEVTIKGSALQVSPGWGFGIEGKHIRAKNPVLYELSSIIQPASGLCKWITLTAQFTRNISGEVYDDNNTRHDLFFDESMVLSIIEGKADTKEKAEKPAITEGLLLIDILLEHETPWTDLVLNGSRRDQKSLAVIRDNYGRAKVAAPVAADDIARKADVDAGTASIKEMLSIGPVANSIPQRDSGGRIKAAAPIEDDDVALNIDLKNIGQSILKRVNTVLSYTGQIACNFWTARSVPNAVYYNVVWSPELGLLVAVGNLNTCITSPDGINWTSRTMPSGSSTSYNCVTWSPELGQFVALGSYGGAGVCITSPDGITWTSRTIPNRGYQGIVWASELGIFVAVGYVSGAPLCISSPDGITWTSREIPTGLGIAFYDVVWSPELRLLVAIGGNSSNGNCATSPDGINWTLRTIPSGASGTYNCVAWSPDLMLLVALGGTSSAAVCATSPDGINWTLRAVPTGCYGVEWSPDLHMFVAVGSGSSFCITSPDGVNWTSRPIASSSLQCILWAHELGLFVTLGGSGSCATSYILRGL